jgi:hypothetical protein
MDECIYQPLGADLQDLFESIRARIVSVCGGSPDTVVLGGLECEVLEDSEVVRSTVPSEEDCDPDKTASISGIPIPIQFYIDPIHSWIEMEGKNELPDVMIAIDGRLFGSDSSGPILAAGLIAGENFSWFGVSYERPMFGFTSDIPISLNFSNETVEIEASDMTGKIWFEYFNANTDTVSAIGVVPTQSALGEFDMGGGTWSLGYEQTSSNGNYRLEIHMEGHLGTSNVQ